jgi:hypothetical protein
VVEPQAAADIARIVVATMAVVARAAGRQVRRGVCVIPQFYARRDYISTTAQPWAPLASM